MAVVQKPHGSKQARHIGHVARHHDDGHGLTNGTAHTQYHCGSHAAAGSGQRDPEIRLNLCGTQSQGGLLIFLRHRPQSSLRNIDNGGQNHHRQHDDSRQERAPGGAGQTATRMAGTSRIIPHQAVHHGGDAGQQFHCRMNYGGKLRRRHLGQENGRHQADGQPPREWPPPCPRRR